LGLVFVYHVISGEIEKVEPWVAEILHENWQIGQKYTPKDDTLYWHPEYLLLKKSLYSKQSMTGKKKTSEHINKINKNSEKIRKTALKIQDLNEL